MPFRPRWVRRRTKSQVAISPAASAAILTAGGSEDASLTLSANPLVAWANLVQNTTLTEAVFQSSDATVETDVGELPF